MDHATNNKIKQEVTEIDSAEESLKKEMSRLREKAETHPAKAHPGMPSGLSIQAMEEEVAALKQEEKEAVEHYERLKKKEVVRVARDKQIEENQSTMLEAQAMRIAQLQGWRESGWRYAEYVFCLMLVGAGLGYYWYHKSAGGDGSHAAYRHVDTEDYRGFKAPGYDQLEMIPVVSAADDDEYSEHDGDGNEQSVL